MFGSTKFDLDLGYNELELWSVDILFESVQLCIIMSQENLKQLKHPKFDLDLSSNEPMNLSFGS